MYKTYPTTLSATKADPPIGVFSSFLSNLAFINHGMRLGMLFSALVLFHSLTLTFAPWEILKIEASWQGLYAWFFSCFLIALIDRFLLSSAVFDFRRSFLLTLQGEFDAAIQLLDRISPDYSNKWVRCPPLLFNQQRSFISLHAGALVEAEYCLEKAKENGLEKDRYQAMRMQIFVRREDFDTASEIYKLAEEQNEATAILSLELGFSLLSKRKDWRETKSAFLNSMKKSKQIHFSGVDTSTIAQAFVAVCNLWTGKAEEGLEELNLSLFNLSGELLGDELLRPIKSTLLLERSLYLATHQEPEAAIKDLKVALKQCSLVQQKGLADKIIEELSWRHPKYREITLNY